MVSRAVSLFTRRNNKKHGSACSIHERDGAEQYEVPSILNLWLLSATYATARLKEKTVWLSTRSS